MKKKLAFIGTCLISLVLLVLIAMNMDFALFAEELKKANLSLLLLFIPLFYLCYIIRALRWKYLLPSDVRPSLRELHDASILGFFATNILPLRAGEFIRPYVLSKWTGARFAVCFASIVSERVFDVLVLLCLLGIGLQNIEARHQLIYIGAQALSILALIILLVMFLSYFRGPQILKLLEKCLALFLKSEKLKKKILDLASDFITGFSSIKNFSELFLVVFYSFLLWLVVALIYQLFLWSFDLYPSFNVGLILTLMIAFAVAVPSAPGFLGTFQFGCIIALSVLYPYSKEFAVAYSIVSLGIQYLMTMVAGLIVLKQRGLSLKALRVDAEPQTAQ